MKLRAALLASTFGLGLAFAASQASAVPFQGSFSVNAWSDTENGLAIQTQSNVAGAYSTGANGFAFNLNQGQSVSFRLFDIWTNEETVNLFEDTDSKPISVDFSFSLPAPSFGGDVDGSTEGNIFFAQWGSVDWDGAMVLEFGALGDGKLLVKLEDEEFNKGLFGLKEGEDYGAHVKVTFKLLKEATDVPEPATLTLLGMGLLGLGAIRRRKAA